MRERPQNVTFHDLANFKKVMNLKPNFYLILSAFGQDINNLKTSKQSFVNY